MKSLFTLVRWKNLLIILLTELIMKYALMDNFFAENGLEYRMSTSLFWMLALSSIFIAAGGYVLNDQMDEEIDSYQTANKVLPVQHFSEQQLRRLVYALNILGIIFSFTAAVMVKNVGLAAVQLFVMAMLYGYANFFKCTKLLGNAIIALLTALVPFLIWIYTVYDVYSHGFMFSYPLRWMHFSLAFYAVFAFLLNFVRELVKDKEDAEADLAGQCRTWAATTQEIYLKILSVSILFVVILTIALYQYLFEGSIGYRLYFTIISVILLAFLFPKLMKATSTKDYHQLSNLLKLVMLIGLLAPLILYF
jgi:4-hydroxybenzoate polyprenyltransferase